MPSWAAAGWDRQFHLPNFLKTKGCEVVAICELRERLGRAVASRYALLRYYKSHEDLANLEDIDAVVAITQEDLYASIAVDLLKSGKHVFTEKPIATNVEDAEAIVQAAETVNKRLMIAYMKRYDEGCLKVRSFLMTSCPSGT